MHRVLYLEEILLNIFGHCLPSDLLRSFGKHMGGENRESTATLAALARTCRLFKDPALDVLWMELVDLTPLARCLHGACFQVEEGDGGSRGPCYSFFRTFEDAEWAILRGYTHRVWRIVDVSSYHGWLNFTACQMISNTPDDNLFPNLRYLRWVDTVTLIPMLRHLEATKDLDLERTWPSNEDLCAILPSLGYFFPNIKSISMSFDPTNYSQINLNFNAVISRQVLGWTHLREVLCPDITLDTNVVLHLSRMPALTELAFTLSPKSQDQLTPSKCLLVFAKLRGLRITCKFLYPITQLFTCARCPIMTHLTTYFKRRPSKSTYNTYLTAVGNAINPNMIKKLSSRQIRFADLKPGDSEHDRLTVEDLRPCMAFRNLDSFDTCLQWTVELTDRDLLELTSAWPNISQLVINDEWGWRTNGGITPRGLVNLLHQCQDLRSFTLAIDTRDYLAIHQISESESDFPRRLVVHMNMADSAISPEAVPALGRFFGEIPLHPSFMFGCWSSPTLSERAGSEVPKKLWEEVLELTIARVRERLELPTPTST